MPHEESPDLSLFLDILQTLERIGAPYMIIGAFAGTVYGVNRVTYDIDIVVDLNENQVNALAAAYPPPRYYADPLMMHESIAMGIMFNIIDTSRGEKADLIPLTMGADESQAIYRYAFQRRVLQWADIPGAEAIEMWCARPEDVILGKLMAWTEGGSRKHETDIYEMMVFHYQGVNAQPSASFDSDYITQQATRLGEPTLHLWQTIQESALAETRRGPGQSN